MEMWKSGEIREVLVMILTIFMMILALILMM